MNPSLTLVPQTQRMYFDGVDHADLDVVDGVGDPCRVVETLAFAAFLIGMIAVDSNEIDTG